MQNNNEELRIGDLVDCGMCEGCQYTNGMVVAVYDETVEVNWGLAVNLWAKKDLLRVSVPKNTEAPLCRHKFATYMGLNESFDYCVFCDEKR